MLTLRLCTGKLMQLRQQHCQSICTTTPWLIAVSAVQPGSHPPTCSDLVNVYAAACQCRQCHCIAQDLATTF
jgi:hypothetical protein